MLFLLSIVSAVMWPEPACHCKTPGQGSVHKNQIICEDDTDQTSPRFCRHTEECYRGDSVVKSKMSALCQISCWCETPGAGTSGHNKIKCSDGEHYWCAANNECGRDKSFKRRKFDTRDLCRVPGTAWPTPETPAPEIPTPATPTPETPTPATPTPATPTPETPTPATPTPETPTPETPTPETPTPATPTPETPTPETPAPEMTSCQKKRKEASSGRKKRMTGHYIPTCNKDGGFKHMQIHTSARTSFCVDVRGNTIPGTRYFDKEAEFDPSRCETTCIKLYRKETKHRMTGNYVPSCDEEGNFTPLQIHTSARTSWCADPVDGSRIEGTTRSAANGPDASVYDEKRCEHSTDAPGFSTEAPEFSTEAPEQSTEAPEQSTEMPGFSTEAPAPSSRTSCERQLDRAIRNMMPGMSIPLCMPNGDWAPYQMNPSARSTWCVDKDGKRIPGTREFHKSGNLPGPEKCDDVTYCADSPPQLCKKLCPPRLFDCGEGMCVMRKGSCCETTCETVTPKCGKLVHSIVEKKTCPFPGPVIPSPASPPSPISPPSPLSPTSPFPGIVILPPAPSMPKVRRSHRRHKHHSRKRLSCLPPWMRKTAVCKPGQCLVDEGGCCGPNYVCADICPTVEDICKKKMPCKNGCPCPMCPKPAPYCKKQPKGVPHCTGCAEERTQIPCAEGECRVTVGCCKTKCINPEITNASPPACPAESSSSEEDKPWWHFGRRRMSVMPCEKGACDFPFMCPLGDCVETLDEPDECGCHKACVVVHVETPAPGADESLWDQFKGFVKRHIDFIKALIH